ncbi:hypothetical protein HDV05_002932 [Chytridiales sp. JEL 0842]|nr:hypothetical protein HDV05_002932 [Chytridiales sp. JEL 0842]
MLSSSALLVALSTLSLTFLPSPTIADPATPILCGSEIDRPCPYAFPCTTNTDCISNHCYSGFCDLPSPAGVKDGILQDDGNSTEEGVLARRQVVTAKVTALKPFWGWTPLGNTDTGNTICGQDIGYQMTSQNENGGNNLLNSGNGVAYCVALSDVGERGCTTGFVGFTTQEGGGAALIIDAYYSRFGGSNPALKKYWIPGNKKKVVGSRLTRSFCNTFCADFKKVAREDKERMVKAQSYGNAIFNGLPTKQIAAQLGLRLPLSIAAIYDAVVNHGYGAEPGPNVKVNIWAPNIYGGVESLVKRAGTPPSKGGDERAWLKRRAAVLNADPLWRLSQPARVDMYLGPLVGGKLPKEAQTYVVNTNMTTPFKSNGVTAGYMPGGVPITYKCYGSGIGAKYI